MMLYPYLANLGYNILMNMRLGYFMWVYFMTNALLVVISQIIPSYTLTYSILFFFVAASTKMKKVQKGTTKQRLANKLKIRKLIPM